MESRMLEKQKKMLEKGQYNLGLGFSIGQAINYKPKNLSSVAFLIPDGGRKAAQTECS